APESAVASVRNIVYRNELDRGGDFDSTRATPRRRASCGEARDACAQQPPEASFAALDPADGW
ncbi:MAG TPA: hypothetical protein VL049_07080, partial [Candidatus Dormibacteraeota bacterium]|nr:hypothetical protein [Candidatus Dormibacteraeota bacterium]